MLIIFAEPTKKAKSAAGMLLSLRTTMIYNQRHLIKSKRRTNQQDRKNLSRSKLFNTHLHTLSSRQLPQLMEILHAGSRIIFFENSSSPLWILLYPHH